MCRIRRRRSWSGRRAAGAAPWASAAARSGRTASTWPHCCSPPRTTRRSGVQLLAPADVSRLSRQAPVLERPGLGTGPQPADRPAGDHPVHQRHPAGAPVRDRRTRPALLLHRPPRSAAQRPAAEGPARHHGRQGQMDPRRRLLEHPELPELPARMQRGPRRVDAGVPRRRTPPRPTASTPGPGCGWA